MTCCCTWGEYSVFRAHQESVVVGRCLPPTALRVVYQDEAWVGYRPGNAPEASPSGAPDYAGRERRMPVRRSPAS